MNSLKNVAWHKSNHYGGKKLEKEVACLGFKLKTFILEVASANHYTMEYGSFMKYYESFKFYEI